MGTFTPSLHPVLAVTSKGTPWTGPAAEAEKLSMEFVDDDTVKMLKEGEPAALLLKRQK